MGEKWAVHLSKWLWLCSLQKHFKPLGSESLFCMFKVKYKSIRVRLNEIHATIDKIQIY